MWKLHPVVQGIFTPKLPSMLGAQLKRLVPTGSEFSYVWWVGSSQCALNFRLFWLLNFSETSMSSACQADSRLPMGHRRPSLTFVGTG